jgi:hypothetical protein
MALGEVPADWRHRRLAVRVQYPQSDQFLDVEHIDTRERLRAELGHILVGLGHEDLDVATIRGGDRRLTRWISDWAYHYAGDQVSTRLAGIRYVSRLGDWECCAVYDDIAIQTVVTRQPIRRENPALLRIANAFGLRVF